MAQGQIQNFSQEWRGRFQWIVDAGNSHEFFFWITFTEFNQFLEFYYNFFAKRSIRSCNLLCKDRDVSTAPARRKQQRESLDWPQFMIRWFIRFPEFTEFNKISTPFRKNSTEMHPMSNCSEVDDLCWQHMKVICSRHFSHCDWSPGFVLYESESDIAKAPLTTSS